MYGPGPARRTLAGTGWRGKGPEDSSLTGPERGNAQRSREGMNGPSLRSRKIFHVKVKNINGTKLFPCACGSLLQHWMNFSHQNLLTLCSEETCVAKPEAGALVQRDDSDDSQWYVVPLCRKHSGMTGQSIAVGDYIALVPAELACGGERTDDL